MGQEISIASFDQSDFDFFYQQLKNETALLKQKIDAHAFSNRTPVAGFEIEAWLIDQEMQASAVNGPFLQKFNHPLAFAELAKFNIELNSTPTPIAGSVFSRMHQQLQAIWQNAQKTAEEMDHNILMIGTLPTLQQNQLSLKNMSELNRYKALNEQILQSRGRPIHLDINGKDHLKTDHHDVMLESATTSLQIHTQIPIEQAHHYYNASIIASAAMVAVSANSPFLFSKELWDESRIPLFEQSIETGGYQGAAHGPVKRVSFGTDYARQSIMECFEENLEHFPVLLPSRLNSETEAFEYLKLHNGTIWRWNRPLIGFDEDGTLHCRIEHRTPAAGPTVIDSIANMAFCYGLSRHLMDEIMLNGLKLTFSQAKDNFYQASRLGLNSPVTWLDGKKYRIHQLIENELIERAVLGLKSMGVSRCDTEDYLNIIMQRVKTRQNGSQWQREMLSKLKQTEDEPYQHLTAAYLKHQQSEKPVSRWSLQL